MAVYLAVLDKPKHDLKSLMGEQKEFLDEVKFNS